MNAAFLLVTTACFTGQTAAPKPELVKPPVANSGTVTSTVVSGGCDCCESGHKLFSGFGGLFRGHSSCDGGCDSCGHHKTWSWSHSSCSSCGSCDSCGSEGLFAKFRARFGGHHSGCCDGGCSSCGPVGAPPVGAKPPEAVAPPKPLPPPPKPGQTSQLLNPVPAPAPTIEIVGPGAPAAPVAPPVPAVPAVPNISNGPRSPF